MKMRLALLLVVKFLLIQSQSVVCMKYVLTLSKLQSLLRWSFVALSKKMPKQFLIIIPVINIVASWCSVGQTDVDFIPHSFFYVFLLNLLNTLCKKDHFQRSACTKHWDLPLGSRSLFVFLWCKVQNPTSLFCRGCRERVARSSDQRVMIHPPRERSSSCTWLISAQMFNFCEGNSIKQPTAWTNRVWMGGNVLISWRRLKSPFLIIFWCSLGFLTSSC